MAFALQGFPLKSSPIKVRGRVNSVRSRIVVACSLESEYVRGRIEAASISKRGVLDKTRRGCGTLDISDCSRQFKSAVDSGDKRLDTDRLR